MTAVRLVSKLLKFKGFRAVGFWLGGMLKSCGWGVNARDEESKKRAYPLGDNEVRPRVPRSREGGYAHARI